MKKPTKLKRARVVTAEPEGRPEQQLWNCTLACGHRQQIKARHRDRPFTATCDTCAGQLWTR